jgi:hypothetical protein
MRANSAIKVSKSFLVLLQFSWERGSKDSRGQGFQGLVSKDFISAFNILSISRQSSYDFCQTFKSL